MIWENKYPCSWAMDYIGAVAAGDSGSIPEDGSASHDLVITPMSAVGSLVDANLELLLEAAIKLALLVSVEPYEDFYKWYTFEVVDDVIAEPDPVEETVEAEDIADIVEVYKEVQVTEVVDEPEVDTTEAVPVIATEVTVAVQTPTGIAQLPITTAVQTPTKIVWKEPVTKKPTIKKPVPPPAPPPKKKVSYNPLSTNFTSRKTVKATNDAKKAAENIYIEAKTVLTV